MTASIELKKRIMRRVYFIFYSRKLLSGIALRVYLMLALLWVLLSNISFINVLKNTKNIGSSNVMQIPDFYRYAFMHTELVVQSTSILAIIFIAFIFRRNILSFLPKREV